MFREGNIFINMGNTIQTKVFGRFFLVRRLRFRRKQQKREECGVSRLDLVAHLCVLDGTWGPVHVVVSVLFLVGSFLTPFFFFFFL